MCFAVSDAHVGLQKQRAGDEGLIRGAAVVRNIPVVTNLSGANTLARALEAWGSEAIQVSSLQEYIAQTSHAQTAVED